MKRWRNLLTFFSHAKRQFFGFIFLFSFVLCCLNIFSIVQHFFFTIRTRISNILEMINLPQTSHWLAILGIHEYCKILGPLVDYFHKHHSGHDGVLHYSLQHIQQHVLLHHHHKLCCMLPIHRISICVEIQIKIIIIIFFGGGWRSEENLLGRTCVSVTLNDIWFRSMSRIAKWFFNVSTI